ncbi:hypothetical protein JX265_006975 [Neoarthrinium moseri]|uniref:F-box domain-containing protein n=1 Tax=Neoarthrinium moseri TaxID=1658444 RepID=A0A9P9WLQ5_9PEZI|nr:uncharacterized protein JN550_010179 [Neoarthrinium moseri]KAI1862654.1 hypothetical protein JN550_010179 [Neoarthrinium moseri]KAI1868996.1 hypothetical protein JX265_006975 [Neoarthrinium moseri]
MASINDLPTETLVLILEYLYLTDLQTFITSQRVARRFRSVTQDILARPPFVDLQSPPGRPMIEPLLESKFRSLFKATDCFTAEERQTMVWPTLNGDHTLPFRRLPWAGSARSRAAYLRPDASWRRLGTATAGRPPITHLAVVRGYQSSEDDVVEYHSVALPAPGSLTMGLLYDVLLSDGAGHNTDQCGDFGDETGDWQLLPGRRLRDHDLLQEYECFVLEDPELVDDGPGAAQCAILYVQGAAIDDIKESVRAEDGDEWQPSMIGSRPRFLSWGEERFKWENPA